MMLRVNVSKRLNVFSARPFVLNVSFKVKAGFTILFGPSGSGKSLTLQMVAGLESPDQGEIQLNGETYFDAARGINVPIRLRRAGYVLQKLALFPHLTVLENVSYGLNKLSRFEKLGRSQKILDSLKIGGLASRMPQTLSGGERQRVALARTLVTEPKILLLDEPLSALDLSVKRLILHDLNRINQEMRILILYVTHDRSEALSLGEHLLLIENGRVVEEGNPLEVLEKPSQESIASLVGVENILEGTILRRDAERGTMRCDLGGCFVEVPYVDGPDNEAVRFGLRSRDILIAAAKPHGLSAQNLLPGRIVSIEPQDFEVHLRVDCGISFSVTTTQNAVGQLDLTSGKEVWLVFKAHSCHILRSHG